MTGFPYSNIDAMKPDITEVAISRSPRLLDQLRAALRLRHCSIRTERAYVHWVAAFVRLHGMRPMFTWRNDGAPDGELLRSTRKKGQKCWRSFGAAFTMAAGLFDPIFAAFRLL